MCCFPIIQTLLFCSTKPFLNKLYRLTKLSFCHTLTFSYTQEVFMNSFSLQSNQQVSGMTTLLQIIPTWEIYLLDQKKSRFTIKSFIGDMKLFAGYFPSDTTVGAISTSDINNFLDWLQNGRGIPCSPKSYARRITTIKSFFRWW